MNQRRLKHLSPQEYGRLKSLIQKRATHPICESGQGNRVQFSLRPCSAPQLLSQTLQLLWKWWGHQLSGVNWFGCCLVQRAFPAWWKAWVCSLPCQRGRVPPGTPCEGILRYVPSLLCFWVFSRRCVPDRRDDGLVAILALCQRRMLPASMAPLALRSGSKLELCLHVTRRSC